MQSTAYAQLSYLSNDKAQVDAGDRLSSQLSGMWDQSPARATRAGQVVQGSSGSDLLP